MKFSDVYAAAKAEGIDPEGGGGGGWEPTAGETYEVEVVAANDSKTKKGYPRFGFHLQVVSGDDQGKKFWDNLNFSASDKGNSITLGKFELLGLGEDFFSADPEPEAIATATIGAQLRVKARYDGDWSDHIWLATDTSAFDDDDDDDGESDEEPEEKPKSKKSKKKGKKAKLF